MGGGGGGGGGRDIYRCKLHITSSNHNDKKLFYSILPRHTRGDMN